MRWEIQLPVGIWVFFMVLCGVHEFGLWQCFSFCSVIDFTAAACHDFRNGVKQISVVDQEKRQIKPLNWPYLDRGNFINHQVHFLIWLLYYTSCFLFLYRRVLIFFCDSVVKLQDHERHDCGFVIKRQYEPIQSRMDGLLDKQMDGLLNISV